MDFSCFPRFKQRFGQEGGPAQAEAVPSVVPVFPRDGRDREYQEEVWDSRASREPQIQRNVNQINTINPNPNPERSDILSPLNPGFEESLALSTSLFTFGGYSSQPETHRQGPWFYKPKTGTFTQKIPPAWQTPLPPAQQLAVRTFFPRPSRINAIDFTVLDVGQGDTVPLHNFENMTNRYFIESASTSPLSGHKVQGYRLTTIGEIQCCLYERISWDTYYAMPQVYQAETGKAYFSRCYKLDRGRRGYHHEQGVKWVDMLGGNVFYQGQRFLGIDGEFKVCDWAIVMGA
ncbi:hypothetical protein CYLTODRAFT_128392 [Cylindrobasidium torrendii FP15055 ss-10]|uniref:Uncharacterized protein n=1 Tax=Cylindrobasidium torrendii FP15055 ss-10 TaxID=1314674 RepID=A0A0D7BLD9_9AGAR|nr:hypothetical protein CYLTODRAFT_128392 [Cylindrobasidium torrendii FP15055 ss-10]